MNRVNAGRLTTHVQRDGLTIDQGLKNDPPRHVVYGCLHLGILNEGQRKRDTISSWVWSRYSYLEWRISRLDLNCALGRYTETFAFPDRLRQAKVHSCERYLGTPRHRVGKS